ncbi:septal ring lytic transglycosylase RlpA family protein [Candidatus Poribacteria bacterium]|nr:septal ring lytic transglycosylase RlpA family protein [Candidatus Poribacteria bacterium]
MTASALRRAIRRVTWFLCLVGAVVTSVGCAHYPHTALYTGGLQIGADETTRASWISVDQKGRRGVYGHPYDPDAMTASHPELPYGVFIRVTNLDNGRAAVLQITDRAKLRPDKRLFVSYHAAQLLDMVDDGVANVQIEPILGQTGVASWYGSVFHGRQTSSGEVYDQEGLTAAHRFLPFGTIVRVTSVTSGKSVLVRINDRGSFIKGRVIDLSRRAAEEIGLDREGKGPVSVEIVRTPPPSGRNA